MTSPDQTLANRVRERAKLLLRSTLMRADLEISKGPYATRVARVLAARDLEAVLDVGANVGQYSTLLRRAGFSGRIVSCEPLSGAYGQLARRAAGDAEWITLHTAVGRERGETTINVSANSFSSSVLPMTDAHRRTAPGSDYVASETVPMTTVRALVSSQQLDPRRTLLKIDTQGYESEVLAGAGDLVGLFGAVQLELSFVELYAGQTLFDEQYERMRELGFGLHVMEPGYSSPDDGRMLQIDGLFVREN